MRPEHCLGRKEESSDKDPSELTVDDFDEDRAVCTASKTMEHALKTTLITLTNQ